MLSAIAKNLIELCSFAASIPFLSLSLWRRRHQARAKDCHFKDKERTRALYAQSLRL